MQIIEVIVSPAGETQVTTRGFAGASCQVASQFLEQALGMVTTDQPTAEAHQGAATGQPLRQTQA
jgi:hypothetical protein